MLDKSEVRKRLNRMLYFVPVTRYDYGYRVAVKNVLSMIRDMPDVRTEGEWILECDGEGECDNLYRCSECGYRYGCEEYDIPNFCPNCGAKMEGMDGR